MEVGKLNKLKALKQSGPGLFLDGGEGREILLPNKEIPEGVNAGDMVEVFIHRDSEDRLIATTRTPKIMVGQCAFLEVAAVNKVGAFLDWGLPKDLLVPFGQQADRMEEGKSYVVTAYVDSTTNRIVASSRLGRWLKEEGDRFQVGQPVDLLVATKTDLGWKAVINHTHVGLVFHRDVNRTLKPGMAVKGFIKRIRKEDQRIDLALSPERARSRRGLEQEILDYLESHGGRCDITDRTPPEKILAVFGVSKGYYKKALGALYRERRIVIGDDEISLATKPTGKPKAGKPAKPTPEGRRGDRGKKLSKSAQKPARKQPEKSAGSDTSVQRKKKSAGRTSDGAVSAKESGKPKRNPVGDASGNKTVGTKPEKGKPSVRKGSKKVAKRTAVPRAKKKATKNH